MTSTETDIARISRRLPPLAGLLDNSLDEAVRTRRRRLMIADNPALTLNALRRTDSTLDRLIQTAAMYGQEATQQLDARIAASTGAVKEAVVFLRIAVAVQMRETTLGELAAHHVEAFPRAVRDACRFYPVPNGPLSDNASHVIDLFEHSALFPSLRLMAIELAGMRGEQSLVTQLKELLDDPLYAAPACIALARMGEATDATRSYAIECLSSDQPERRDVAMDLIACDPRISDDALLQLALAADPATVDAAWAIATCSDPRGVIDHAAARDDLPAALRARIAALAGYPDAIVNACAAMADADGAITANQAGLLELTLGAVPVEARCEPNDKEKKSRALRTLLLRVLRAAHIGLCNDADVDAWDVNAILANPAQAATVRLRDGLIFPVGVPPALGRALPEVPHALRGWLYIERACLAHHAFALSPFDTARRQDAALMIGEFVDAMRAA
ncbi:MAG: hypothetical protein V4724_39825 [Pseudomonadota bacterium]